MGIQRCKKCGTKFNYMDILESIGWGYKSLNCRVCRAQHNLKMLYIFILAILLSLPLFFINQIRNFALRLPLVVFFYITYITIMVGLYPFIVKYKFKADK